MSLSRLPVILFALVAIGFASDLALIWPSLPARVATHFDLAGHPNGWSSREQLLSMTAVLTILLGCAIVGARFIKSVSLDSLNVPNRDYWLAPERSDATLEALVAWLRWLLVFVFTFISTLASGGAHANLRAPIQFPTDTLLLIVGFLACVLVMIGWLVWRFRLPPPQTH